MELEFRTKDGNHMVSFKGEFATRAYYFINSCPEFVKTSKRFKGKEYICFECVELCGYVFHKSVAITMKEGDYIKIID